MRKHVFWIPIAGLIGLAIMGVVTYLPGDTPPQLVPATERTVTLFVHWDGDVHWSERYSCDVWTASYYCELRRGGDLGVVLTRTIPITATAAVGEPGTGIWTENPLTWDLSSLELGPYETHCQLKVTDGEEVWYGYIEGLGHDGYLFFLVDKFQIGQVCFFPLRFSSSVN